MNRANSYPPDWYEISNAIRAKRQWSCEDCGANLDRRRWLLDAHHLDGDRTNCTEENLRVLCRLCHIEKHPDNLKLLLGISVDDESLIRVARPRDQADLAARKRAFYTARVAAAKQCDDAFDELWSLLTQAAGLFRERRPLVLLGNLKRMIEGNRVRLVDDSKRAYLTDLCVSGLEDVKIRDKLVSRWEREMGVKTTEADIQRGLSLARSDPRRITGWETDHPLA
jgi:hypothetical protein